jgi:hypothetical protein
MASAAFAHGVADVRADRRADFDVRNGSDAWEYERGRQWAVIAPKTMPIKVGRRINPKAISVFIKAEIP